MLSPSSRTKTGCTMTFTSLSLGAGNFFDGSLVIQLARVDGVLPPAPQTI
jgi:hypothetical protein